MFSFQKKPISHTRILALDYGRAHTGVAISDPTGTIVRPLSDIGSAATPEGLNKISAIVESEAVGMAVVGMPVSLRGEMGEQAQETAGFIKALSARLNIPVISWDERFTSKIANAKGRFSGASRHSLAACVLLEDYLGSTDFLERGQP